jgi:hypothetical protein
LTCPCQEPGALPEIDLFWAKLIPSGQFCHRSGQKCTSLGSLFTVLGKIDLFWADLSLFWAKLTPSCSGAGFPPYFLIPSR